MALVDFGTLRDSRGSQEDGVLTSGLTKFPLGNVTGGMEF
jgi:hypothetical protein